MGYIVTVDERGRIVIPKDIRERLNLKEGSKVEISVDEKGRIIITVRRMSVDDIYGIAGRERVSVEEIEEALGFEGND